MQIFANQQQSQLNFGMMRIRQIDGTTRRVQAKGKDMITKIYGDVMSHGKCIEKFSYANKEGFDIESLAAIVETLCAKAENKDDAISTTLHYLHSDDHNVDYNA